MRGSYPGLVGYYPAIATIKVEKPVVYELGYSGDWLEAATVFYAASVLVSKYGGTAFEPQGGIVMDAEALLEAAKQCEEEARTRSDEDRHEYVRQSAWTVHPVTGHSAETAYERRSVTCLLN